MSDGLTLQSSPSGLLFSS